jgi:hypothetical protein
VSQALKGKKQNIPFQKEADKQKTILWNSKQTNSKSLEIKIHSPFLSDRFFCLQQTRYLNRALPVRVSEKTLGK